MIHIYIMYACMYVFLVFHNILGHCRTAQGEQNIGLQGGRFEWIRICASSTYDVGCTLYTRAVVHTWIIRLLLCILVVRCMAAGMTWRTRSRRQMRTGTRSRFSTSRWALSRQEPRELGTLPCKLAVDNIGCLLNTWMYIRGQLVNSASQRVSQ